MKLKDSAQRFKTLIGHTQLSDPTKERYSNCVDLFIRSMCSSVQDVNDLRLEHFQNYLLGLADSGKAPSTVNVTNFALRAYAQLILDRTFTRLQLPKFKLIANEMSYFTPMECLQMITEAIDYRLKAYIVLGFDCGLRISELIELKIKDIDKENQMIHIRRSKRGKSRSVPYSDFAASILNHYLLIYKIDYSNPESYLFPGNSEKGNKTEQAVSSAVKKHFQKYDFYTKQTYHSLRHSFGAAMAESGCSEYEISILMGHASMQTTRRYVHLNPRRISEIGTPCKGWKYDQRKQERKRQRTNTSENPGHHH